METWMWFLVGGCAAAVLAVVAVLLVTSRHRSGVNQTTQLRDGFGPEYARTVGAQGRSDAEKDLLGRQKDRKSVV